MPPVPQCTWPRWLPLQVMRPQEVGSTLFIRAETGWSLMVKNAVTRFPPCEPLTPGLAPGWGPGCVIPGNTTVTWCAVELLLEWPIPPDLFAMGNHHEAPANITHRIIQALKLLRYDNAEVQEWSHLNVIKSNPWTWLKLNLCFFLHCKMKMVKWKLIILYQGEFMINVLIEHRTAGV